MTEASLAAEGDETDAPDNTIITDASLFRSSRTEVRSTFTGTRFFLSNANVMRLLAMSIAGWDDIPNAVKENCYFVISNPKDIFRHARGQHSTFEDNCWSCLVLYYIIWYGWLYHQSGFGLIPKIIISPESGPRPVQKLSVWTRGTLARATEIKLCGQSQRNVCLPVQCAGIV